MKVTTGFRQRSKLFFRTAVVDGHSTFAGTHIAPEIQEHSKTQTSSSILLYLSH